MEEQLHALRTAGAEEAHAYFATEEATTLVSALAAAADSDLLELLDRPEVRTAAVEGVLARLDQYAVPSRLADVKGVVAFRLTHRRGQPETFAIEVADGALTPPGSASPDVTLVLSHLGFLRLVTGQDNAGLEHLAGRLLIEGDAALALEVGGLFRVPGTDEVAVDPTRLDPVDVATALKGVPAEHVRAVMSGDLRPVVLDEIFRRLPDFVNSDRARGARLCLGIRLTGNPSGEIERHTVRITDGVTTVTPGQSSERRDATLTCEGHDFLRLATGHLNAITSVLRGQLKVRGDKAAALQFLSLVDFPKAR